MKKLEIGDIVARKSYKGDIYFKVIEIIQKPNGSTNAILKGLDVRLEADAPVNDLEKVSDSQVRNYRGNFFKKNNEYLKRLFVRRQKEKETFLRGKRKEEKLEFFELPGRVLHLDGDPEYLELCLTTYKQLGITASGFAVPEYEQPSVVGNLLKEYIPDLLVLTGHDGLVKDHRNFTDLESYRTSSFFIESVKEARRYEKSRDDLIIWAGACQSHYEAILQAGANFASSPQRIMIHAFDPVFVIEKLAYASIQETISISDVIKNTITGFEGVGGIESRGKFRLGLPKSPY